MIKKTDPGQREWNTLTKQRHLTTLAGAKRAQDITGSMINLIATERTVSKGSTPIQDFTRGRGLMMELDREEWTWQLRGSSYRPLVILEDLEPTNQYMGIHKTTFRLKFDCDTPLKGSIITFEGPFRYQVRVQENGWKDGDGYVFECQLMTDDENLFLPKSLVRPGRLANCMWASYGEMSVDDGPTKYAPDAVFKMRSWLTMIRKQYQVSGHAARTKLNDGMSTHWIVAGQYPNGKTTPAYWVDIAEAEFEAELNMERENVLFYSRASKSVFDLSSMEIAKQGPGLQQLMEDANQLPYSVFSLALVEDFLYDIFYNRVPFNKRHILMFTGERGLRLWERAIRDVANGNFSDMSRLFIDIHTMNTYSYDPKGNMHGSTVGGNTAAGMSNTGAKMGYQTANALAYGSYYTCYRMFPGGSITIAHLPVLDDQRINLELDDDGYPLSSSEFYIFDLGFGGDIFGGTNLKYMTLKNGYSRTQAYGMYTPKGPNINNEYPITHTGDYYSIHHLEHLGIHMEDPKMAGWLKPNSRFMY